MNPNTLAVSGKTHHRLLWIALAVGMFFSTLSIAAQPKLVASSYSDRYHLSTCKIAQKISPEDLLIFKTPEEAFEAGYGPCKKCNPPVPKGKENMEKYNFQKRSKNDADSEG